MENSNSLKGQELLVPIDCQVHLPEFEGPLDLLLHLIKNHELDILNLPIATITRQYLLYLDYMRELNLDLASEYLVMAATLTFLKSEVILPKETKNEETGPDPRAKLIRRLMELKCYKDLAAHMRDRPRLFRDAFLAKNTGTDDIQDSIEPELALTNPYQLISAFKTLLARRRVVVHKVVEDHIPIAHCIHVIVDRLKAKDTFQFSDLMPPVHGSQHVISMFLGVLEMTKLQMTGIRQEEVFGPIEIFRRVENSELEMTRDRFKSLSWQ